jgi:type II secretory pathway pseudopilin PulG
VPLHLVGNDRGFSLVEALIASSILATALLSLARLVIMASSANDAAGRMTHATLLAAQKVEDLRASSSTALEGGGIDSPAPGFRREWSIGALASDPTHVVIIEIVVRARGSTTRMVALRTRDVP